MTSFNMGRKNISECQELFSQKRIKQMCANKLLLSLNWNSYLKQYDCMHIICIKNGYLKL